MTLRLAQTIALIAATLTTGLVAGLFFTFANSVMPALRRCADRTFVEAMNKINADILNGWFMLCYLGSMGFTAVALLLQLPDGGRPALAWTVAAALSYLAVLVITGAVNVPLNNRLAKTGADEPAAVLAAARGHFEGRWITWNGVRMIANVAAFGCLVAALVAR